MRPFEYAHPETEAQAVELLNDHDGNTAILAGGTDLIGLMKQELLSPERVVDLQHVESMRGIAHTPDGVSIGALTTLEEIADSQLVVDYPSLLNVVDGHRSIQIQSMGTLGGDLCHLPNCWYFRNGYGLLALENGESLVEEGDNRYHAILGANGPAKFVSASRFAPALIALGAQVRILGPGPEDEETVPLEYFYITPKTESQGVNVMKPGQFISHVLLPAPISSGTQLAKQSAAYEVLEIEGLDWPLVAAACSLEIEDGIVRDAKVVLGHVAPTPWVSHEAASAIIGRPLTEETADEAGRAAVASARALSKNEYKIWQAKTAVKRALLAAAGLPTGGL